MCSAVRQNRLSSRNLRDGRQQSKARDLGSVYLRREIELRVDAGVRASGEFRLNTDRRSTNASVAAEKASVISAARSALVLYVRGPRVVLQSTTRNSSDPPEPVAARLSAPP
jgi:hypothetical protein